MNSVQKMNIIGNLPVELCHEFLLYLNVNDIFKSANIFNLHGNIIDNHYIWRLKFKIDKLQSIKRHQKSEKYENYEKKFQCIEQGFYKYNYELRQLWLTKSWKDALKPRGKEILDYRIPYVDEKIFVMRIGSRTFKIRNFTTNKIISKFKMRKHLCAKINVQFPFFISFDEERNEIFVWNVEEHKLLWKRQFSRNLDGYVNLDDIFCTNYNTIAALTSDETQISLIDISTGTIRANLPHDSEIWRSFFCNNLLLIQTHRENCLNVWDVDNQILKYSIDISAMRFKEILYNGDTYAIFERLDVGYVLDLNNGRICEFETKLDSPSRMKLIWQRKIVLHKSHVVYVDKHNNLKVVDYITRRRLYNKEYEVEIREVIANNNFIILVTSCDIRIIDPETFNELRTFSLKAAEGWEEATIYIVRTLESKLIFQYDEFQKDIYNCWIFILDFDVDLPNVEGLETR